MPVDVGADTDDAHRDFDGSAAAAAAVAAARGRCWLCGVIGRMAR